MPTKKPAGSPEWTDPDDAPEPTAAMLADAEAFEGNTFVRRGRGRPKSAATKEQISVRLDRDVLAALRAEGPGWQSQVNGLLRRALQLQERSTKRVA
jgi:uncharacterized protein (DUF4415 family)